MKTLTNLILLSVFICNSVFAQQTNSEFPKLTGPYFGQKPPGNIPELFASGIVSTGAYEHGSPVFSKDLKEIYWTSNIEKEGRNITRLTFMMKCVNGIWSRPEIPEVLSEFEFTHYPFITPDGKKFFFAAGKKLKPQSDSPEKMDIYYAERTKTGWGNPICLDTTINSPKAGSSDPTVSMDGTLFFGKAYHSNPTATGFNMYVSVFNNGTYSTPVKMEEQFNQYKNDYTPLIAPDKSYFIFSSRRAGSYGYNDLYISFRQKDGSWGKVKHMGNRINTTRNDRFPNLSPDGKYLFFNSAKRIKGASPNGPGNGTGDVYWVSSKIIDYLRNEDLDIDDQLYNTFNKDGYNAAINKYQKLKAKHSAFYNFDNTVLYNLGIRLIQDKKETEALEVFKYNSKLFSKTVLVVQDIIISLFEHNKAQFDLLSNNLLQHNNKESLLFVDELNILGYKLLNAGLREESISVFVLNTKLFPESADVYSSLGEAYAKAGNKEQAIENYEKALKITPNNQHTKDALNQLKENR